MALLLLPAVRWSRNERDTGGGVADSRIARAGRCVGPASRPPEPGVLRFGEETLSSGGGGCPEEAGQLTRDRDDGHVVRFAAGAHAGVEVVQSLLGTV